MDQKDDTPPLDKNELDHVLQCYRSLQARRPDLAAGFLLSIAEELKRAKSVDEAERFYREAIAGATQLAQIDGAFILAASRGDTECLNPALRPCRTAPIESRLPGQCRRFVALLWNGHVDCPGHERSRRSKGVCATCCDCLITSSPRLAINKKSNRQAPPGPPGAAGDAGERRSKLPDLGRQ